MVILKTSVNTNQNLDKLFDQIRFDAGCGFHSASSPFQLNLNNLININSKTLPS
jgi:hypothetical protein